MEFYSFPISLIRQHLFCPRIPFFNEVLGLKVQSPSWTNQGADHHKKQVLLSKKRTLKRFELENGNMAFEVNLVSEGLGVHGRCDAIITTVDEVVPVEFKLSKKVLKGHILQLGAYSIAAEESYGAPCQIAFILHGLKAKAKLIEITPELRGECYNTVQKIKRNFERGILPESSANEHQCGQCEFLNFCNDRF